MAQDDQADATAPRSGMCAIGYVRDETENACLSNIGMCAGHIKVEGTNKYACIYLQADLKYPSWIDEQMPFSLVRHEEEHLR